MFTIILILISSIVIGCAVGRFVTPPGPSQPPFVPTEELANLLKRQPLEDRVRYLGLTDVFQLYNNFKMCLTEEELQWLPGALQEERNMQHHVPHQHYEDDYYNRSESSWTRQKPIAYDDDDTYDNFYSQREEEYRQEYGDDYEDAIDDAWEDHQRGKRTKKR